jgi:3-oxoacyl-[acyl-carrier-protein] synthase-3
MTVRWPVEIVGTGASMPEQVVGNDAFCRRLDTTDEWIVQRTGIHERRIARPDESTLKFATGAARTALEQAGLAPAEVDLIICATITPEHPLPATAVELQHALGCGPVPAFDLVAACSGFVWGLITAAQYISNGMARNVLVLGADCMTRMADMEDRATAVLFGDGAGAAVVRRSTSPERGILAARMGADGSRAELIWVPAGGSKEPASVRTINERLHYMRMKGREVYKFAVTQMQAIIHDTLQDAGLRPEDVAFFVPHQSNLRIIESAVEKMGLPPEKVMININRYGNTSAASVPIALHEARQAGRIKRGDIVLMVAFGAGLTWGSVLLRM